MSKNVRHKYKSIRPEQFRAALDQLGLTAREFARLSGWRKEFPKRWLEGELEVPHQALVITSLLTLPGAIDLAERVFDAAVIAEDESE